MIETITGIIQKKTPDFVVVNVGGIGLKCICTANTIQDLPKEGEKAQFSTYLHVREDMLDLYGFASIDERKSFLLLIGISGIGPKLAITILSGINTESLKNKIVSGDVSALTAISGIGPKTAKRMIIELKEKFIKMDTNSLGFEETDEVGSKLMRDAAQAMVSLGYKLQMANQVLRQMEKDGDVKGDLAKIIKKALAKMG
ncbi:MAG: Holliday junction branch migration protein RuvA [Candidatus Marinimicrobia bacterium]|jgi:Holliday junction DNA helicase RuvA|nr:Holliday junction branch migration protein RuvA [Candidatus Neomarinimicrobiota bacterium]MBT3496785.1 Holliday junction branch migration protein RuvA [Candidatus Neomarinimicrobiota bacterium]MBT3691804.1 Holliday junction branch migration protein RuvA [Candidatus Neomarinimicrobiota bacterium]MBT3731713.1 Holliday junction branch migration protein RuvA [Candidatus Neomarinimicrobiota bacterium]MBT4143797.1 Holliday junction branch migration protein RuvA [Candidatus Neomarinimicrobiota bact